MQEWVYILLGFFGGCLFTILLFISIIKKIVSIGIMRGKKDE